MRVWTPLWYSPGPSILFSATIAYDTNVAHFCGGVRYAGVVPRTPTALLLLACLVSCDSDVTPPPEATVRLENFDTRLIGEPVKPEMDLAVIELVSLGAEPREQRSYRVAPGHRQALVVKTAVRQTIESDGNPLMPPQKPEATVRLEITRLDSIETSSEPVYRVQLMGIEHAGFHMAMVNNAKEVDESFERLGKYVFELGISDKGRIRKQALLDVLPELTTLTNQVWNELGDSLSLPLPDQAIGLGAKWKVDAKSGIADGTATRTYELVKIEGELLHLREVQALTIKDGSLGLDSTRMDVKSMTTSGTGEHLIDLRQVAPIRSALQLSVEMTMEMNAGAETLTVGMEMKSERTVQTQ